MAFAPTVTPQTIAPRELRPGMAVKVSQQIPQRDEAWTISVTGTVVKLEQSKTGAWFAHAKDDKLWLDRLTLRKADGEITELILDAYSTIEAA